MLWWAVTPFLIACALSLALLISVAVVSRRRGVRWAYTLLLIVLIPAAAFIPFCVGTYVAISPFRFGEFHADDFESVGFSQVQVYLPRSAHDITMINTPSNHHTKFKVSPKDLDDWMDSLWVSHGKRSPLSRDEAAFAEPTIYDRDKPILRRLGLTKGQEYLLYEGPYQGDWGGPTLWYSQETQTAWQRVGYW